MPSLVPSSICALHSSAVPFQWLATTWQVAFHACWSWVYSVARAYCARSMCVAPSIVTLNSTMLGGYGLHAGRALSHACARGERESGAARCA